MGTSNNEYFNLNFQWTELQWEPPIRGTSVKTSNNVAYNGNFQWDELQWEPTIRNISMGTSDEEYYTMGTYNGTNFNGNLQ